MNTCFAFTSSPRALKSIIFFRLVIRSIIESLVCNNVYIVKLFFFSIYPNKLVLFFLQFDLCVAASYSLYSIYRCLIWKARDTKAAKRISLHTHISITDTTRKNLLICILRSTIITEEYRILRLVLS